MGKFGTSHTLLEFQIFKKQQDTRPMGEARRRTDQGLPPRQFKREQVISTKISSLIPITEKQREQFFSITKTGAWIGIACLILFWIVVRFIGPMAGWWIPADAH